MPKGFVQRNISTTRIQRWRRATIPMATAAAAFMLWSQYRRRQQREWLAVGILSVVRGGQEDDGLFVVDFIEDPPASDPDPPGRRFPVAESGRGRNSPRCGPK